MSELFTPVDVSLRESTSVVERVWRRWRWMQRATATVMRGGAVTCRVDYALSFIERLVMDHRPRAVRYCLSPLPFAAASVALGAAYMRMAGAPPRYILINLGALAVGLLIARLIQKARPSLQLAGTLTAAVALALLATAVRGPNVDGASRWIPVAGISFQPSLMLLPAVIVLLARNPHWLSAIGLAVAGVALALQPDRAMAGALTAALAVLRRYRRDALLTLTLAIASCGFAATLVSTDRVPPAPFVERVVQSAFGFDAFAGVAIVVAFALMLIPAIVGVLTRKEDEALFAVFGATWLAVITFAIIGNYPTPLAGYGASGIIGYCLSSGLLAGGDIARHSRVA